MERFAKYCPSCGAGADAAATFCNRCGAAFPPAPAPPIAGWQSGPPPLAQPGTGPRPRPSRSAILRIIPGLVVSVALCAGVFYYKVHDYDPHHGTGVHVEHDKVAHGSGFEIEVPGDFGVVHGYGRLPAGSVALSAEHQKAIIIIRPIRTTKPFAPGPAFCKGMGAEAARRAHLTLEQSRVLDARFGKTCEERLSRSDGTKVRIVPVYKKDKRVAVFCLGQADDDALWSACKQVIGGVQFE